MKHKLVRVKDLQDQIGMNGPRPFLYCRVCTSHWSANKGDYFTCSPDHVMKCCDKPLIQVLERCTFQEV